jgi:hypothetical protein
MTQPPQDDIHVDPPVLQEHARFISNMSAEMVEVTNEALAAINLAESNASGGTDELSQAFRQDYDVRAQRAEERARPVPHTFVDLGATATKVLDAYERVDADAATNVARERGLLPPR